MVVVPTRRRRRSGAGRRRRWPTAVRAVAGVDVAAVLLTDALPVDIRHASKIDRARVADWAERVLAGRPGRRRGRAVPVKVLVTGASGMLGGAVADALAERGDDGHGAAAPPVRAARTGRCSADVADPAAVAAAVAGQDAVVHLAAKVDVTGPLARVRPRQRRRHPQRASTACRAAGVARLVHVSSPSVAHAGASLVGAGAGPADPARARGHYARTKAMAELLALGGGPGVRPRCVAIRPHLVWGPGDTQLVGRIVDRARAGRLPSSAPGPR